MIDVGTALRASYFTVLNGNVTYNGSPVPLVDEKLDVNLTEHDIWMMFGNMREVANDVKHSRAVEMYLDIVICNHRNATSSRETIESVASQVLNLLFPSRQVCTVSLSAPLALSYAQFTESVYQPFHQVPSGYIVSKTLTFKNRITQP